MAFQTTSVDWDLIRSITHPKVAKKVADNITGKIPLLHFLNKIGHKEMENGGVNYTLPVLKELPNTQAYTGMTTLSSAESDSDTVAIYERKQLSTPVVATGTKLLKNSGGGEESIVNYLTHVVEVAEEGMKDALAGDSIGIFSSKNEADTGVTGLQTFLTDSTTTGTVGGLSRATHSWWQHQRQECGTGFNTSGLVSFRTLMINISRGDEGPAVIVCTPATYGNLDRALTGTIHYNNPSPKTQFGDVGFEHIFFHGIPVLPDDGVPTNRAYFLNLKYMKLLVHADRDMTIRDWIAPANGDYMIARMLWAGNLVCNNLARQGQIYGLPDTWA